MAGQPLNTGLLERIDELAHLDGALDEACAGRGRFVVLEGPAGIGKTAVLAAVRESAAARGMRVLRARGTELEREFAFGVVRQLFEPPLAHASELERGELLHATAGTAAAILELPGAAPAPDDPASLRPDVSFAVLHGLYWLCANLAAAGPVCLVVDDAHWADGPSLRYLAFLLTRLEELDVALVLATRPQEARTDTELLAALAGDSGADLIRLSPLSRAAVAELVEATLVGVPDPLFVDTCLRETGGSPFLLRVLVDALREGGVAPTADAARYVERIGARPVGRSVRLKLRRLPEQAGRLARALAILEESELLQTARLADLDEAEAAEAAELLASAGIIESGRPLAFIHPIVRSGIYSDLSGIERARGHSGAARLLAEEPGARERVAQHLLLSEPAADHWVVERLVAAACAAGKQGAPEAEAVLLRRALAEPPEASVRPVLLLDLGMAEASAGLPEWPEHLQQAVDAAPTAEAAGLDALVLGLALSRAQRFEEAVVVLDRARAAVGDAGSDLSLALEAAAVVAALNDPSAAASVASRRKALLARAADQTAPPELLAAAAMISVLANEPAEIGAGLADRALRAGGTEPPRSGIPPWFAFATWFSQATLSLLWTERYVQLQPLLDVSIANARARGDGSRLAAGLAHRGWLALRRGDLAAAEADSRSALAAAELPAPTLYRVLNCAVLVVALTDQGALDAAEQELAPLQAEAESGSITAAVLRVARGRLRVAQGRVAEGLEDFLAVGEVLTRAQITCPSYLPWRSQAALAHLALGQDDEALRLANEEVELARAFGTPRALGAAKRVAGVVVRGDRGESLLRESVGEFELADSRVERARALADLGALLRRRNRRTEARDLLREALDVAHQAGAKPLAQQAEIELRATGARPRRVVLTGLDSLTASERRVAELAGEGLTNREIAQTLFITTRTVEGHLTSVFRKLTLDSRDGLPAVLAGGPPVPA